MSSRWKMLAVLPALVIGAPAPADPTGGAAQLEPVTVIAPADPLYESDRLLRAMLERAVPCLGCDAVVIPPRHSAAAELLRYLLLPAVPAEPSLAERIAFEQKVRDAPDLEYLVP